MPDKVPLIQAPTPLHRLPRVSADLNVDLWIKRDDLTGFAMGGNKGRKLEYQIADVLATGAEVVVSCGALQSNFIRQLGAACAMYGLKCAAAVMETPFDDHAPHARGLTHQGGNVRLDEIFGVDLQIFPNDTWETLYAHSEALAERYIRDGYRTHVIPVGGSSPLGAYAFVEAAKELAQAFDWIVFASSSGSTQTGLSHAFRETETKILGMACDPEPEIVEDFARLSDGLTEIAEVGPPIPAGEFLLNLDYVGPGYGVPSEEGNKAIEYLAQKEGILLDPIYTGKAFAGLIDLAKKGEIKGKICFWHTGGLPTLFAVQ